MKTNKRKKTLKELIDENKILLEEFILLQRKNIDKLKGIKELMRQIEYIEDPKGIKELKEALRRLRKLI